MSKTPQDSESDCPGSIERQSDGRYVCATCGEVFTFEKNTRSSLPQSREAGDAADLIVRDCCEAEPCDPDREDAITITVEQLRSIVEGHLQ